MSEMSLEDANAQLTAPGAMFELEDVEVFGVPTRVWKHCPDTLRTVLELTRGHGDKTFLVYEDERTTFEEHFQIAATLASRLHDDFGVRPGDRIAIAMRNLPEWAMAFWAASALGAVVVPLNAWWKTAELRYGLEDSGSTVAFVDRERLELIRPELDGLSALRTVVATDEKRAEIRPERIAQSDVVAFADLVAGAGPSATLPEVTVGTDDDATIFYTSGTTGQPKGAVGTQRNICTNLMNLFFLNTRSQMVEPPKPTAAQGADTGDGAEAAVAAAVEEQHAFLLSVPLFHATGCHAVLVANSAAGAKLVMMHHWNPERALELIERERITTFGGVPAMVMQVLDSPDFAGRDTSSVKRIAYGGAPAPTELVRRITEHFPASSPSNGYGLTETSALTTMNTGADYRRKPDSVGPPVPVCDVAVVPAGFTGDVPTPDLPSGPDVVGELWVKGPNVVRGYWNKPDATAASFTKGWLRTGDIASVDEEGFVHIVDRAKDMVIRGGENVYSVEVEDVLFDHPAVADVAVIGVPHPVLGEEVGAVVVLHRGAKIEADELTRHVAERLAGFKVPTHVWFRGEPLPRNRQGKVLKRELRQEIGQGRATPTEDDPDLDSTPAPA